MKLTKKIFRGQGNGIINFEGYKYAKILSGELLSINTQKGIAGPPFYKGTGETILNGNQNEMYIATSGEWQIELYNYIPRNGGLSMANLDSGEVLISGDEEIVFRGQDMPAPDVSHYRIEADTLSKLFSKAQATKSPTDAAIYLALKQKYVNANKK